VLVLLCFLPNSGNSQGIYTEFGQNRVQYRQFHWTAYSGETADLLYHDTQLKYAVAFAEKIIAEHLPKIEKLLGYKSSNRPQFMIYGSLSDYKQNNVGYVNPQWHSGGITFIPAEALPIYHDGNFAAFKTRIIRGLSDFLIREMIYGGTLQDRFERLKSPALPYWFTDGLSSIIAEGWSSDQETELKDGFAIGTFNNVNLLSRDQQALMGRSIWKFIIDRHGKDVIAGIMFIARYTHSAEAGISYYTKNQLADFLQHWKAQCRSDFENSTGMILPRGKAEIPRKINKSRISGAGLNQDGKMLSLITHDHGKFAVWLYSVESKKTQKIYEGGQKVFNQINDYHFPKAKWRNDKLYILTFEKGNYFLLTFNKKGKNTERLSFSSFKAVNDFALHPTQDSIVFSATTNSISQLYKSSLTGGSFQQITHDTSYKENLLWLRNNHIIYTNNSAENINNLLLWDGNLIHSITRFRNPVSINSPILLNDSTVSFLSDLSGLQNAWYSPIYTYAEPKGLTHYARSIFSQTISGNKSTFAEAVKVNGRITIFTGSVNEDPEKDAIIIPINSKLNDWKKGLLTKEKHTQLLEDTQFPDSAGLYIQKDTTTKTYKYQTGFAVIDYPEFETSDDVPQNKPLIRNNLNPITPDFIVTQIDNRTLGTYLYDNSVPMMIMRNPWLMPYLKISLSDLQRNLNIEGGVRTSLDLAFTDFHFKMGYYANRLDYEFLYFRRNRKYDNEPNLYQQYGTQLMELKIMLPSDERLRYSFSTGFREDHIATKITEMQTALIDDKVNRFWSNRMEIMFDNSTSSGLNQMTGSRIKFGLQHMMNVKNEQTMLWAESDIRLYIPVWKSITFAQRIAGVYNLGKQKSGYYLGGVENWTAKEQLPERPVFLNPENIQFQSWVCNLRGHFRGARMGNSFLLSNTELRWQVMKMIYKRPVSSEFIKHFTITTFIDAGCAFTGKSPADIANPYNTNYLNTPNYSMSITSRRNPWLMGAGYGIRSRVLGYFIKYDRAWGWQESQWNKPIQYISLGLDF
jgi:hypothetical protein